MKFRMFTSLISGRKIAVSVDEVISVKENKHKGCIIYFRTQLALGEYDNEDFVTFKDIGKLPPSVLITFTEVREDFDTVFSRLNTIAG